MILIFRPTRELLSTTSQQELLENKMLRVKYYDYKLVSYQTTIIPDLSVRKYTQL